MVTLAKGVQYEETHYILAKGYLGGTDHEFLCNALQDYS